MIEDSISIKTNEEKTVLPEEGGKYIIIVEQIDSIKYYLQNAKGNNPKNEIKKITDFKVAKKLLTGIVEFDETEIDYPMIKQINFKNNQKRKNKSYFELDDCSFKAYYPDENILLCEGGHSTDVSFNLKNGKETEEAGNPDLFIFSPNNKFRLNGSYDGQECNGYFLQVEKNKNFEKIINLEQEVKRQTKISICNIRDGFWSNNNTLYLEKYDFDFEHNKYKYIKIEIIEK